MSDLYRRRVVIIDSFQQSAEEIQNYFSLSDFDTRISSNATDGVRLVQNLSPVAVICDSGIADIDYYEVARIIRSSIHNYKPFLVSVGAISDFGSITSAIRAGFDIHVARPVDWKKVANLVQNRIPHQSRY